MITLQRFEIEALIKQVENTLIHVNVYSGEYSSVSESITVNNLQNIRHTLKRILEDDK